MILHSPFARLKLTHFPSDIPPPLALSCFYLILLLAPTLHQPFLSSSTLSPLVSKQSYCPFTVSRIHWYPGRNKPVASSTFGAKPSKREACIADYPAFILASSISDNGSALSRRHPLSIWAHASEWRRRGSPGNCRRSCIPFLATPFLDLWEVLRPLRAKYPATTTLLQPQNG
jgi:hypothetical protein